MKKSFFCLYNYKMLTFTTHKKTLEGFQRDSPGAAVFGEGPGGRGKGGKKRPDKRRGGRGRRRTDREREGGTPSGSGSTRDPDPGVSSAARPLRPRR